MANSGSFKKGDGRPRKPKGATSHLTKDLKAMIEGALSDAGGQDYLARQAEENPSAFMSLVGRLLPKDINANIDTTGALRDFLQRLASSRGI